MLRLAFCAAFLAVLQVLSASSVEAATIFSRLQAAQPGNLTFEDDSREIFIDVSGDNFLGGGDALVGYARIGSTASGGAGLDANNSIYAVFSQTFDISAFNEQTIGSATRYFGEFTPTVNAGNGASLDELLPTLSASVGGFGAGAMIAFVEVAGGFSEDLINAPLLPLGGVDGAITSILDGEGQLAFTAGLANPEDFFAFETAPLSSENNFVTGGIDLTEMIATSFQLGNFGAGLSIIDSYLGNSVQFNRVIGTEFYVNANNTLYGQGNLYDVAIVNGNFGGINNGAGGVVQGGGLNFINNADLVVNASVVPEPSSIVAFLAIGALGIAGVRRRRNRA